jgi:hypothetical protein
VRTWLLVPATLLAIAACAERPPVSASEPKLLMVDAEDSQGGTVKVRIEDATGLVVAARSGPEVIEPDVAGSSAAVDVDDAARTLSIEVGVFACATEASVSIQPRGAAIAIDVVETRRGACDAMSKDFAVVLDLVAPIAHRPVVLTERQADVRSWATAVPGTDGRTRAAVLVDRSTRVSWVEPADASNLRGPVDRGVVLAGAGPTDAVLAWSGDVCDTRVDVEVGAFADTIPVLITLTNESHFPCSGATRAEGLRLTLAGPDDAGRLRPSLLVRH